MNSSTPVEILHTILLGPYKYLLRDLIPRLSDQQKKKILARMAAFSQSGITGKLYGKFFSHYKSFVGRDFKAWTQMAPFIVCDMLGEDERKTWIALSKV